jgi:hypothetical protein
VAHDGHEAHHHHEGGHGAAAAPARARYWLGTAAIVAAIVALVAVLWWLNADEGPTTPSSTTVSTVKPTGPNSERIGGSTTTAAPTTEVPTTTVAPTTAVPTTVVPTTVVPTTVPPTTAPLPALTVNLTVPACAPPGATVQVLAVSSAPVVAAGLRWSGGATGVSQMSGGPERWLGGVSAGAAGSPLSVQATVRDVYGRQASVTQQLRVVTGCDAPPVGE